MIEAKTPKRKAFWAALIAVSISMTVMSISKEVDNFFGESLHITADHLEINEMLYPPLKVCLNSFMYWTNWTRATKMNFTKAEVLYAMSYLKHVYVEEIFDVDQVEKSFFEKMKLNNMSLLEEFYESVAIRRQNIVQNLNHDEVQFDMAIEDYRNAPSSPAKFAMCYTYSGENIKSNIERLLADHRIKKPPFDGIMFNIFYPKSWSTESERAWLTSKEIAKQSELFQYPVWITYNGNHKNGFYENDDSKNVRINAIVRYWKSNDKAPCRDDQDWIQGNTTCFKECDNKFFPRAKKDDPRRKFTKKIFVSDKFTGIYFFDPSTSDTENLNNSGRIFNFTDENVQKSAIKNKDTKKLFDQCVKSCGQEIGCRVWSFEISTTYIPVLHYESRSLILIYPSSVEVMKEVDLRTWGNFVSSIGGLLGIWTGASVLTILQVIYLMCCQGNEENESE